MVNRVNTAVNNNIYAGRKPVSKYNQAQAFQQKEVLEIPDAVAVNKYANVQEKNYTLSGAILNKLYIFAPERV